MRIDVVSIFPAYLTPLSLSLSGKAQQKGILEVVVHDLRKWTHDRHHTVDDTPYGGGAGMVMKPEPWGEALDEVAPDRAVLVVPTPSGVRFDQRLAEELARHDRLIFACGRYEGIDQRVIDHAGERLDVREVSIGDYVLNGGEVAALAIIEAVVRLLPGFMGNADSLSEESHGALGLLEYPVYTKPSRWRGRAVPDVLLSGDHARISAWRHEESLRRTAQRRPDLLHGSGLLGPDWSLEPVLATAGDVAELLVLTRACWMQEALANQRLDIPALHETLDSLRGGLRDWETYVVRSSGRLVASVRGRSAGGRSADDVWEIGRLMVAPDLQGRGLGGRLLSFIEACAPQGARTLRLYTGRVSTTNLRMYRRAGYRVVRTPDDLVAVGAVMLEKRISPRR